MAEDSVFDSGLSGILGDSSGSQRSSNWEDNLLGELSEEELAALTSEPGTGDTVRMASQNGLAMTDEEVEAELRRDVRRAAVEGCDVVDDLATLSQEMERAEQAAWGDGDTEIGRFVTGKLYEGHSPKQIKGLLHLIFPAARAEAFWAARGGDVASKYGRLGFLYVDAADFRDDGEMDDMLGGQKKIGQMALESLKPAERCGDCTMNRAGFCMRYNLSLDADPAVKSARQAKRILQKFARRSEAHDREVAAAQEKVDAAESRKGSPAEYDRIISSFLTSIGQPRTAKGDTGRVRMSGQTEDATRPTRQHDGGVEDFIRGKLASGDATFATLRGAAMATLGTERAKAWFRTNRSLVTRLIEGAAKERAVSRQQQGTERAMGEIRTAMVARFGEQQAERMMAARGSDPSKYVELLNRSSDTESRRIATGRQAPRAMPDAKKARAIGHLDDEMRQAAVAAAARGVPEGGVRASLASSFGDKRLAAFEGDCPGEIGEMVRRAALGFGAADGAGIRMFEELLEQCGGDLDAAVAGLRKGLGRPRSSLLLKHHPKVAAVVSAASRTHGQAADDASDRRVGGTASAARPLTPEASVDYEAIARAAADMLEPEPELMASELPPPKVDPTLVARPEMEGVDLGYVERRDAPDPIL